VGGEEEGSEAEHLGASVELGEGSRGGGHGGLGFGARREKEAEREEGTRERERIGERERNSGRGLIPSPRRGGSDDLLAGIG
jgi:hypothetical protein